MRKIKFRVWDKDECKYHICGENQHDCIMFDLDNWAQYCNLQNGCGSLADGTGTYDLEQYTGLHDKNGKEIYEGDIVRTNEAGWIAHVVFQNGIFMCEDDRGGFSGYCEWEEFEVIGNVYELTDSESITAGIIKQSEGEQK